MSEECRFCNEITEEHPTFFSVQSDNFTGKWDPNPVRPGHALVIPKRHIQFSHELSVNEACEIFSVVVAVKALIRRSDLMQVYDGILASGVNEKSEGFIAEAQKLLLHMDNRPPDAFNDGLNDGPAAVQTISHLHWHIMPRWDRDVADPRGGIRHMFAGMGNYEQGVQK